VAKTRRTARKSGGAKKVSAAKRGSGRKKTGSGRKKTARVGRAAKVPKELNLRPLKKQLKAHMELLSRSTSTDPRVQGAIATLQQFHERLNSDCDPTMSIPLE
jgi:hypothetical protein